MVVVFRFLQSLIQAKELPGAWNPPPTAPGPLTAGAGGQQEKASPAEGLLPGPTLSLSLPAPSALICPRPDTETPTSSAGPNRAARGCPSLRSEEVTHGRKQKGALGPSGEDRSGTPSAFRRVDSPISGQGLSNSATAQEEKTQESCKISRAQHEIQERNCSRESYTNRPPWTSV